MIGIFDVGYYEEVAVVGCVMIARFDDAVPVRKWAIEGGPVKPYKSGQFWERELPPLLRGIESAGDVTTCVIDAYVDLGQDQLPGLGRILHQRIGIPVIGVAKSQYPGTPKNFEVVRGSSKRPLYVSAAGFDHDEAKGWVVQMSGDGRIPTMLRLADRQSRTSPMAARPS